MVETDNYILVFDYYKGELAFPTSGKEIFFFVSHTHADHFNPEIFTFHGDNVHYILSKDTRDKIEYRHLTDNIPGIDIRYIGANESFSPLTSDTSFTVQTYKSTDCGVAFLVCADAHRLYHAGDLYLWWNPGLEKAKRNDILARFQRELALLKTEHIDVAFIPLDYRLDSDYATGFDMYMKTLDIDKVYPMHMWDHYEYISRLKNETFASSYKDKIADL